MTLLDELRRRRVVRVAVIYVAGAFATLQAADVLVPALHLPAWIVTAVAVLIIAGLPLALALAWIFDVTPAGVHRSAAPLATPAGTAPAEAAVLPPLLGRRTVIASGVLALAGVAFGAGWVLRPPASADGVTPPVSVAVLPFADLSDDRSQEYFGDGLAEELLNTLRGVDIDVASRTSSFAFKGRSLSARQIAHELGVDHIIDGSVRKAGDRLRIAAQVIDVRSDRMLWSETFDRRSDDIFAIQTEIARSVANALRVRFAAPDSPAAGTASSEAYDLYLLGLYHWHQRTPESLMQALAQFMAATELDPGFARAWAGVAFTYYVLPDYTDYDAGTARRLGRHAADRAVHLDPNSAEARTALGSSLEKSGHVVDALAEYDRAIELDPGFATAHHWRAVLLIGLGRLAEAEVAFLRARQLDPAALALQTGLALVLDMTGRTAEALAETQAVLARAPGFRSALNYSFVMAAQLGRAREFEPQLRGYLRSLGEDAAQAGVIIRGIETPADRATAIAMLDDILARQAHAREAFNLLGLFAVLGAREQTLQLLEDAPDWSLMVHRGFLDFVHDDPRYLAVRSRRRQPVADAP